MKKVSLLGISAVLGMMALGGDVNASIVSRGFLDNALTDYVKNTALDLKANQSDLTDLSNKIGNAWPYMFDMSPGLHALSFGLYPQEMNLENTSDLVRFLFGGPIESGINEGGVLNALAQSVYYEGAFDLKTGQIDGGFRSLLQLTNGWTDSKKRTYLGVTGLNDAISTLTRDIGTLPEGITVQGMYEGWMSPSGIHTVGLSQVELDSFFVYNPRTDSAQRVEGLKGGLLSILNTMMSIGDFSPTDEWKLAPFWKLTQSAYKTDELSTKIGTLPTGNIPSVSKGMANLLPDADFTYPDTLGEFMDSMYNMQAPYPNLSKLADAIFLGTMNHSSLEEGRRVKGLHQITQEIGSLPTEILIEGSTADFFAGGNSFVQKMPDNIGDLIFNFFALVPEFPNLHMLTAKLLLGSEFNINAQERYGIPGYKGLVDLTKDVAKIGILPTGNMPGVPVWSDSLMKFMYREYGIEEIYPTSLAGLMELLFGNTEKNSIGILQHMVSGFPVDDGTYNHIGLVQNYVLATDANELATTANTTANTANETANAAKSAADASTAKIGTLPTEYATVGAALTAIKGIAEEAKAVALAAIPDPKKEGATGKYVLTVDIIGDNATYRWEKIDRSATESSTTE